MRRPRYADVAATLAVVLALGGTSYAVTELPRHSVGTPQLKAKAVTQSKLADNVQTVGPAGPQGVAGATGPTGPVGQTGVRGPAGPAGGPLDPTRLVNATGPVITIQPGAQFINVAAPCPGDAIALSGGYTISGTVHVSSSIRSGFQQSWQVTVDNPGTSAGTVQAFSVCLTT
jgi:hypothetical protein